ncbi:hypothetical protein LCGC14_0983060, partial [marine sediment metagenome]
MKWDSGVGNWTWGASKLVAGDFTGNGKADAGIIYNYTTSITLFVLKNLDKDPFTGWPAPWRNNSDWVWSAVTPYAGDFNGDGKDDLVLVYRYSSTTMRAWVFTSTGSAFNGAVSWYDSTGWNVSSTKFAVGDINNDGKDDLVALYNYGTGVKLWKYTSNGSKFSVTETWYAETEDWNWNSIKITAGDFNGDGKDEVSMLYNYNKVDGVYKTSAFVMKWPLTSSPVKWWDNFPTGYGWSWNASAPLSGDFNGDEKDDMAIVYGYENETQMKIFVFTSKSNHDGSNYSYTFSPEGSSIWFDSGEGNWNTASSEFTVADFDGDGIDDLVALYKDANSQIRLFGFKADPTDTTYTSRFNQSVLFNSGPGQFSGDKIKLASGDFNGDDKDDIVMLYDYENIKPNGNPGGPARTAAFVSISDGTLLSTPAIWWDSSSTGSGWSWDASDIVTGDFIEDPDNKDDLAIAYYYSNVQMRIFVLKSLGTSFDDTTNVYFDSGDGNWGSGSSKMAKGDYNFDGKDDIAIMYGYAGDQARIFFFLQNGSEFKNLTWWDSGSGNWGTENTKIFSGDYDGDGRDNIGALYDYPSEIVAWAFYNRPLNKTAFDFLVFDAGRDLVQLNEDGEVSETARPMFMLKALSFDVATTILLEVFEKDENGDLNLYRSTTLNMTGGQSEIDYYQYLTDMPGFSLPDGDYVWRITTDDNLNAEIYKDRNITIRSRPRIKNAKVLNLSPTGFVKVNQPSFSFDYESTDNVALMNTKIEIALDAAFKYGYQEFNVGPLTDFTLPRALEDGYYFYRIKVTDRHASHSAYSPTNTFEVNTENYAEIKAVFKSESPSGTTFLPSQTTLLVPVTVKNLGTKTIRKEETTLSYEILVDDGSGGFNPLAGYEGDATPIPFDLPQGQSASFLASITTPATSTGSNFKIVFDLKKGTEWLSFKGSKTYSQIFKLQDKYVAQYSGRAPPAINDNTSTLVSFTATNTSVSFINGNWVTSAASPLEVSYDLYDQQGTSVYSGIETLIDTSANIIPGSNVSKDFNIDVPASIKSGIYKLSFDLLFDGVLFSTKGVATLDYPIAVRAYGAESYWPFAGNVNLLNGNMVLSTTDFSLSGRGPALSVSRTYNSLTNKWTFSFESSISETEVTGYATLIASDGGRLYFEDNGNGTYTSPAGVYTRLVKNGDDSYTFEAKDKTKVNYNSAGKLASIEDLNGNTLTFDYGTNGKVDLITDASGKTADIFYDTDNVVYEIRYTAPNGQGYTAIEYTYTGSNLTKVRTRDQDSLYIGTWINTIYTYTNDQLSSITSPEGNITQFAYVDGKLSTVTNPVGAKTSYVYDPDNKSASIISPRGNDIANEPGYTVADFTTKFSYSDFGNIVRVVDGDGLVTNTYWDERNNVLAVDDYKAVSINIYDDTSSTGWANVVQTTTIDKVTGFDSSYYVTYDEYNFAVSGKDDKGNKTTIIYDEAGNAINTTDSTGVSNFASYDSFGNIVYIAGGIAASANLIANSSVEAGSAGYTWTSSDGTTSSSRTNASSYSGKYSLSQTHTEANTQSRYYIDTKKDSVVQYRTYMITAYLKTDATIDNTGGVKIWAGFNKNNLDDINSRLLDKYSQAFKTNGDWQPIYLVATAPKDARRLRVQFKQEDYLGTSYIDGVVVEELGVTSPYNALENAGFETSSTSIDNWTASGQVSLIDTGLHEDFDGLTSLPAGFEIQDGTWTVDTDQLKVSQMLPGVASLIYAGNTSYADYAFSTDIYFGGSSGEQAYLAFRSQGFEQDEYRLDIRSESASIFPNTITLSKYRNGTKTDLVATTLIGSLAPNLKVNGKTNVAVEVIGGAIKVLINGVKVIYVLDKDPLLTTGRVGLGATAGLSSLMRFDDVHVTLLGAELPPSGVAYIVQTHADDVS